MPEVVDACSLASPVSVCRTKHLHLRCSVDFTRRVLTGTAALTVQSQEDNLRSLVRWDRLPVPASSLSPRFGPFPVPHPRLLCASLGAPPQPATRVLHLLFSPHSFLSVPFSPHAPHIDPSQPNLSLCSPSSPTTYTCLLLHPFPQSLLPSPWTHPRAHSTPRFSPSAQVSF